MTQQIINIGAAPNDGEGDNLRTAFDKVNDNFSNVWAQGPVDSNVQIQGNTISTLQVNQDLALSPNGTGNIRLNNNTIPGANNTWFLGSTTNQWRGLYVGNIDANNVSINSELTVPGDAYIGGNLTVEGDTIQIGNIVTDTKTIQLANTAANAIQANGSGITVGANDNIATFLYNSTSNSWVTNLQVTYANGQPIGKTPGGSNTYIQFNDSGNFGGNANFTYNRATGNFYLGGANLRAVAGNSQPYILQVPGIAFQGGSAIMEWDAVNQHVDVSNSFSIAGTLQLYGNYPGDGAVITTTGGSGVDITIEPSGNLYLNADGGEVIVSDQTASVDPNTGALKVLGGIGVNGNVNAGGNISAGGWTGNLIPSANAVYSLGNSTNYWANLWVANNTIYIGGVALGMTAGNVLTVGGNAVLQNNSNSTISTTGNISAGNVSATGNITGAYVKGNGSELTNLPAPTVTQDITSNGAMSIMTYDGVIKYVNYATVEPVSGNIAGGNISTTGNVTANSFIGLLGSITNLDSLNFSVENISALVGNNGVNIGAGGFNNLLVLPTDVLIQNVPLTVAGNILSTVAGGLNITANTVANGTAQIWNFGTDGRLTFPGTPRIDTGSNNFEIQAAENISLEANAVVNIYTDTSGTTYQWQFGDDGNLTLPANGDLNFSAGGIVQAVDEDFSIRVQDADDDGFALLLQVDDGAGNVLGSTELQRDRFVVEFAGGGAPQFRFTENGQTELPGNVRWDTYTDQSLYNVSDNVGNGSIELKVISFANDTLGSNVRVTQSNAYISTANAAYTWTFDNTGNLSTPGSIIMPSNSVLTGTFASPAPSINGFDSVSAVNFSATGNITGGNLSLSGNIAGNIGFTGADITINNSPGGNEGGEIKWALPSPANTVLSGTVVQDVFQNGMRFFESGGNNRGLYMDLGNAPNGSATAVGYRDIPQISLSANVTANATNAGRHFYSTTVGNLQVTIPDAANVAFPLGATLTIVTNAAGNVIVAQGTGVSLYMAGSSTTGNRTVGAYGLASVMKVATDTWVISGTGVY